MLVNALGLNFNEVTASSLLKVDLAGEAVDSDNKAGPLDKKGFATHSAIHRVRADVVCVWHSHHKDCAAISMLEDGLQALSPESLRFMHGNLSYHPFEDLAVDSDAETRLSKSISQRTQVLLLQNNGPMVLGTSIEEAFHLMYSFARACTCQVKALGMAGGDISKISQPYPVQLETMLDKIRQNQSNVELIEVEQEEYELAFAAAKRAVERLHGESTMYC